MSWLISRALMEAYANSPSSPGLVEGYSQGLSSDGKRFALSSEMSLQQAFLCSGKTTEFSLRSRYGITFARLTDRHGEELLTWYLADFRAKPIHRLLRGQTLQMISGRRCDGSWQMSLPGTYLPRTSPGRQSTQRQTTLSRWATKPDALSCPRKTWVLTTFGEGAGLLHTPTTRANYCAPSMQKWKSCQAWRQTFGCVTPESHEYLMGWPIGWTDLKPLEMGRFQSWLSAHLPRSPVREEAA